MYTVLSSRFRSERGAPTGPAADSPPPLPYQRLIKIDVERKMVKRATTDVHKPPYRWPFFEVGLAVFRGVFGLFRDFLRESPKKRRLTKGRTRFGAKS